MTDPFGTPIRLDPDLPPDVIEVRGASTTRIRLTEGRIILSRYLDGTVREALMVRKGLEEQATREAVIAELRRIGYTVSPPGGSAT
jgi:hypothetical protein